MSILERYKHIHLIVLIVLLLVGIFGASVYIKQNDKLRERQTEKIQLTEQKREAELKNNNLKLLSQYKDTDDYLIYYARYRLGYSYPYEVIIDK